MSTPSAPAAEETPSAADRERDIAARQHPNQPAPSQLYFAIADGRIEEVERELAANGGVSLSSPCAPYTLPLYVACQRQHLHIIKNFLKMGAHASAVRSSDLDTTLHVCAGDGFAAAVDLLLAAGADPKLTRRSGQSVRDRKSLTDYELILRSPEPFRRCIHSVQTVLIPVSRSPFPGSARCVRGKYLKIAHAPQHAPTM